MPKMKRNSVKVAVQFYDQPIKIHFIVITVIYDPVSEASGMRVCLGPVGGASTKATIGPASGSSTTSTSPGVQGDSLPSRFYAGTFGVEAR